jgi:hypothetical protein
MSTVEEIRDAIQKLSFDERSRLERELHGWADDAWDQQIKADAQAGKLDRLLERVDGEIDAGRLRELP